MNLADFEISTVHEYEKKDTDSCELVRMKPKLYYTVLYYYYYYGGAMFATSCEVYTLQ